MKAILVTEKEVCRYCKLRGGLSCFALSKEENDEFRKWWCGVPLLAEEAIYEGCPLRPLPQEREFDKQNILPIKVDGNSFVLGWNACLDEILRETNKKEAE